ncbi:metallophosphoesterase [Robiginitalea sp. SC105]|uniref:metallophosphoesterase n=1 Tax=Robiginitalea sp. SC105 TaxID=2762332 RepID=UPI00163A2F32|nr:metallophosphoesterase [Robiginitalea sp. SC105]MBC2838038.1 metallophosphoesterase [Robiginitalea sp. SC105]
MRKLVIGDIHGGLQGLLQLLERIGPDKKDFFIFLGDYVDGWSEAAETVDFLIGFGKEHQCLFLKGNHDELCEEWLTTGEDRELWLRHGGEATKKSYAGVGQATRNRHLEFYRNLEHYYLDGDNRLFLHAGFTNQRGVENEYFEKSFYWDRTLWETALSLNPELDSSDPVYPPRLRNYREIFIGHTPVIRIGKDRPHRAANVWNVDTGAAFKGPLSALEAHSKEVWQSDPVHLFYPGESGRN